MKNNEEVVLQCRMTKIELEHEVLLREMEVVLVGMVGLPISAITLILQFGLFQNGLIFLIASLVTIMGLVYLNDFGSERKDKMVAKEKELDALILELTKSSD